MNKFSSVDILGAGPAGLYTAILLKRHFPHVDVRISEQNSSDVTFGFGVVFSDQAINAIKSDDAEIFNLIAPQMQNWDKMKLSLPQGDEVIDGVGFSSIGRLELNTILTQKAKQLGVQIQFNTRISDVKELKADLVIGADGLNSIVRQSAEAVFAPKITHFGNHFAWFGASIPFDMLTQTFVKTDKGAFNAHHYRFTPNRSTFIVECDDDTFKAYGFAGMSEKQSAEICNDIFEQALQGTGLVCNKSLWNQFPKIWCDRWVAGRKVILGDAAHTAHFSIGSGTRLAMEDAIALVADLRSYDDLDEALAAFQRERPPVAKKIVEAANVSATWYETFAEKLERPLLDFAIDYITRSGKIDMDSAREFAPKLMRRYDAAKMAKPDVIEDPVSNQAAGAIEIGFDKDNHQNCSEILWQNLDRNPEKTAVIGPLGKLTYLELISEAGRWGNAFLKAGLERGERIAFFLDDTPTFTAAFYGAVRAGFVPVLLNIQTKPDILNYFLKDSGARFALVEADLMQVFAEDTVSGTQLETIILANAEENYTGFITAIDFLTGHETELTCADTNSDDMAFWMYSSGTTGRPKGIVHLHHDMAYSQSAFGENVLKLNKDDICYSVPKAYFAYGFGNSIIFPMAKGATALMMPGQPRPEPVLEAIEVYKPTVLFGLPTLYTALARADDSLNRDLSSLRQSMSAAEILSEDVYNTWKNKVGHGPTEGLGSTEMLHIYLSNKLDDHRLGSAGARVPGYDIRLETPEGKAAGTNEEGVMLVRGHSSAPTYWNRPDKTQDTMRGEWIYTGDRFIERDGYYYFQGRADDLIKISGQWVWPLEVERCLNEHPDIHECAVLSHQLDDKRMALRAVVSLVNGVKSNELQTLKLREYVKSLLTPYKSPRIFEYVNELPKTGTGKIDRQAIMQKVEMVG